MKVNKMINRKYLQISLYVIFTCVVIYVLGLIAANLTTVFSVVTTKIGQILTILQPVVIAFVIAYVLNSSVDYFEDKLKKIKYVNRLKSTRGLAVLLVLALVSVGLVVLVSLIAFSVTDQIRLANFDDLVILINQYSKSATDFFDSLARKLTELNIESTEINKVVTQISQYIVSFSTNMLSGVVGSLSNITGFFTTMFFSIIIAIYFLIDGSMLKTALSKVTYALFSDKMNRKIKGFVHDAHVVFSGYLKGQLLDVLFMMVFISLTLSIVGVKFAVLIGIVAGIGNMIPYCGPFIAYGASALVCFVNGDITKLVIAIIALVVIQAIDANIVGPKLLSYSIEVHPLLVIVSLIIGSSIGGLFGMLLAVPVGALIKVIFMRYIESRIAQKEALRRAQKQ